jgi:cobalt-zinc-cadmium efflux system protein
MHNTAHRHGHAHDERAPHDHHDHHHDHRHGAGQAHAPTRALAIALALTLVILVAEGVGGWLSNSLALLADAGHVLTDAGALGLSLFVAWLARQAGSQTKTFGYLRWEILAALINGATLLGISALIIVEAVLRLRTPEPVAGGLMLFVAIVGFVVNGVAVWLLHGFREGSLNVRGAYLHILGDALASGGTVVAAGVIHLTGWTAADPLASIFTVVLIIAGAWSLVRESVDVLLEATPPHIALDVVRARLADIEQVESVHDLHVWTVTSGMIAMSAHAVVRDCGDHQRVLERAHQLAADLGIQHVTIQLESDETFERAGHLHP